jgi:hypothetical protein
MTFHATEESDINCCSARQAAAAQLRIESGCFEGLGSLPELLFANALAVAEGVDVEQAFLVLDTAASAAGRVVDGDEDLVAGVNELLGNRI